MLTKTLLYGYVGWEIIFYLFEHQDNLVDGLLREPVVHALLQVPVQLDHRLLPLLLAQGVPQGLEEVDHEFSARALQDRLAKEAVEVVVMNERTNEKTCPGRGECHRGSKPLN